jgi:hypothetical protein
MDAREEQERVQVQDSSKFLSFGNIPKTKKICLTHGR